MVERASRNGQRIGNYRLVRLLGQGGFAEVYLAEHIHLNTQAAVKLLNTHLANDGVEGFRNEARMIAGLIDPHIVRVLDFGVENSVPYLVMDYAPNGTLRQQHPKGSRLPLQLVVNYVQQVARALQYAHDQRLIHRDVKPENMLVGRNREILLSDFGIALVAQSSQYQRTQNIAGTLAYMAPEQIQAHPRPASDQYSLGIVAYEWLGGQRPFQGTMTEIAIKHATAAPPPLRLFVPDLPPAVEQVVLTALQKDPHSRFPTAQAFAQALEQASSQHSRSFANVASASHEASTNLLPPSQVQTPGPSGSLWRPGTIPAQLAGGFPSALSHEAPVSQEQPSLSSQMQSLGPSGSVQRSGVIPAQSMSQTNGQSLPSSAFPFDPPGNASHARFYVRPVVLLILMGVIAALLFAGLLEFPGLFFWFLGGDLMQLWFLVLVVLGFLYRRALARLWKEKAEKRGIRMSRSQAFSPEYPAAQWPALSQERSSGQFIQGLLHIPLVLLIGFLVYYFFIAGYTFHVTPHLAVTGDCNGGTITVQGKAGSDMVSLKAGLLTIEGFGNYDSANHVLNVSGNLCGFTLQVPATTNLHLSSNDATIWVRGVKGTLELDNNAGDINIDGSTLLAGSVVSNNAGKITISNSCLMAGVKVESNGSSPTQRQVKPCSLGDSWLSGGGMW
jgi:serine/threonine protein kinase